MKNMIEKINHSGGAEKEKVSKQPTFETNEPTRGPKVGLRCDLGRELGRLGAGAG